MARASSESRAPAEVPVASAPVVPPVEYENRVPPPGEAPSPPVACETPATWESVPSLETLPLDIFHFVARGLSSQIENLASVRPPRWKHHNQVYTDFRARLTPPSGPW